MESKLRLIDAAMKDRILMYLCDKIPAGCSAILPDWHSDEGVPIPDVKAHEAQAILETFAHDDLIGRDGGAITMRERAHAFLREGGYTLRNEVFAASLYKLQRECEELMRADSTPERLKKLVAGILDPISKVASLFHFAG